MSVSLQGTAFSENNNRGREEWEISYDNKYNDEDNDCKKIFHGLTLFLTYNLLNSSTII